MSHHFSHHFKRLTLALLIVSLLIPASSISSPAAAVSAGEWQAGSIIDDEIFYNNGDMSVQGIQDFMNQKNPACDTNGTGVSEFGGGTRAQWGTSRGYPPPYVCLKDYFETPNTGENNLQGRAIPGGALSSAQIIKAAADAHGVSAKALLVILQKESPGPLLTDTWPLSKQYRNAMGYGCPDTAPCDPQYEGFYNQMMNAARQYKLYANNPQNYRYKPYQGNSVQYNPQGSCGASNVDIQNKATAGLYNYTLYQPNQAALNNLYGSGDSCSAYGNRNFWRLYNDWFDTTKARKLQECPIKNDMVDCVWRLYNPANAQQFLTSSIAERNALVYNHGFILEANAFYAAKSAAGNIPVYRISHPQMRKHLWTIDSNERDVLVQTRGYVDEGIAFYVSPANQGMHNVYRLSYGPLNKHLWTTSEQEKNDLSRGGYNYEGVVFSTPNTLVAESVAPVGKTNIYRFAGFPNNGHFWTTSIAERNVLIRSGFAYEGVAGTASPTVTSVPVYRLYSIDLRKHFWTISEQEKNGLIQYGGFKLEDTVWYASATANASPMYRLSSPALRTHMWTASIDERDALVRSGLYKDEGIGWYQ